MPRRQDVPSAVFDELIAFHRRLRLNLNANGETKSAWYQEVKGRLGKRGADLAWAFVEANIPLNQITQNVSGENTVSQNNNPGGTNVTQTAGGHMTGVNATGDQAIGDINIISDLDQSGAAVNSGIRSALVEARRSIEGAPEIDPALKPMIIEQFDRKMLELKKGDQKNPNLLSGLWNMVYGTVKEIPTAVAAIAALDKLRVLLGL